MIDLVGLPSDDVPAMLATGRTDITTLFISMSKRHPDGKDADYIAWHSLDHRPEQHRLAELRASFRLVSTPACRAARAASDETYDSVDHLITYLFVNNSGLPKFYDLNMAMIDAGRTPYLLPLVGRSLYQLTSIAAAHRIKVGADVMPWWPAKGVYLLVELGSASAAALLDVPGVGGIWSGSGEKIDPRFTTIDTSELQVTYCFLDDDPAETGERLRPVLQERWRDTGIEPLLAAPFHGLVAYEWDRYLP